jgi:hypothetical protein
MYSLLVQIESYQSAYRWWQSQPERVVEQLKFGIRHRQAQIGELDFVLIFGFHDWLINVMGLSISLLDFIAEPQRGRLLRICLIPRLTVRKSQSG